MKKAAKGLFVGYNEDVKGFRIWFPLTDRVDTKRDVIFKETDRSVGSSSKTDPDDHSQVFDCQEFLDVVPQNHQPQIEEDSDASTEVPEEEDDDSNVWNSADESVQLEQQEPELQQPAVIPQQVRVLRDRDRIRRPSKYEGGIDPDFVFLAEEMNNSEEPRMYHEAMTSPHAIQWKRAMDEEIESLKKNHTWET